MTVDFTMFNGSRPKKKTCLYANEQHHSISKHNLCQLSQKRVPLLYFHQKIQVIEVTVFWLLLLICELWFLWQTQATDIQQSEMVLLRSPYIFS